jgi:serine protease
MIMLRSFIATILILFGYQFSASQTLTNHVSDELIVRLSDGFSSDSFLNDSQSESLSGLVTYYERISKTLNAYLIRYNPEKITEQEFIEKLSTYEFINTIQRNHVGSFRSIIPNDELFSLQWYLKNTGENNGIPGADINILNVWKETTGGQTILGHEIVVGVIDAGIDLEHVDLADNFWHNKDEIPDNGIDDDGNGYIDDILGWHANKNNADITSNGSHGTNVSGVIGAKGNNLIGVAGINWNIKIIPVILEQVNEAAVLRAYEYLLTQRKIFNESKGLAGSFIVATNSSWGIDYGKPSDAPIWCAMYDSLGKQGILNVGATTNLNINVDVNGDLPTACPSEFMIGTTSSTRSDARGSAGFGKNTIELAAPGVAIQMPRSRNRYTTDSGTSFATPMVTGAIALLYSSNLPEFIELALKSPESAARIVKDAITFGVQRLPAFEQTTKSGGRLNLNNSFQLLKTWFSTCPAPTNLNLVEFETNALIIKWEDVEPEESDEYNVRYRVAFSGGNWIQIDNVRAPFRISNLQGCASYEIQVQKKCANGTLSPYSNTRIFTTDSCCEGPRTIDTLFTQPNATRIIWRNVIPADFYIFEFKEPTDTLWREIVVLTNQYLLRGLNFCTTYQVRISAVCNLDTSNYSAIFTFSTKGCGACTEKIYCGLPDGENNQVSINKITLGSFTNLEDRLEEAYEDFTGPDKAMGARGKRYPFTLEMKVPEGEPNVHIGVWIDFNHDAFFDETKERALYILNFNDSILTRNITIPLTARIGTTRMRIGLLDGDLQDTLLACPEEHFFGRYEDYCIEILQQECPGTPEIELSNVGTSIATFNWGFVEESIAYTFRWRKQGDQQWKEEWSDTVRNWTLTELQECNTYEFEVRSVCLFDTSEYVRIIFETQCPTATYDFDNGIVQVIGYPNPFNDHVFISVLQNNPEPLAIRMYNNLGQLIQSQRSNQTGIEQLFEIQGLSNVNPGVYFIEISSTNYRKTIKFIKN